MKLTNSKRENYLGNVNLKRAFVPTEFTQEQIKEFIKCSKDCKYFIENYCKIVNVDEGIVGFKLFDFQQDIVVKVIDNRFVICKMPRQYGKTTTIAATLLWYVIFHENYSIAVLAHKQTHSIEILSRVQNMYEHLPRWMQIGIVEWNKGSINLENGSKVMASSTSSSAIRGGSFNLIYLDEFAFVPPHIQEEFFASVYPTISSGKTSKIIITSTPKGLNLFYKLWRDSENNQNSYERVEVHWSDWPGRDEKWKQEQIRNTSAEQFRQEFECEFIGSSNTLISPSKLKDLIYENPIEQNEHVRIYETPKKDHTYVSIVDTARGVNKDNSTCVVIDITEPVAKVVACYENNNISPTVFPEVIAGIHKRYNKSFILVESNDIGGTVVSTLHNEFELDNILMSISSGRAGQVLSSGFGTGNQYFGVRMTMQVKRNGCMNLKALIENDQLIINDINILHELTNFAQKGQSFEAETGTDDLVITLVLFGWLTEQEHFKQLTDASIMSKARKDAQENIEETLVPFGISNKDDELIQDYIDRGYVLAVDW